MQETNKEQGYKIQDTNNTQITNHTFQKKYKHSNDRNTKSLCHSNPVRLRSGYTLWRNPLGVRSTEGSLPPNRRARDDTVVL